MKKITTPYTTLVLLVVFIGAFLSQSLSSFGATNSDFSHTNQQVKYYHSTTEVVNSFGNDLFENENEDDSDWLDFVFSLYVLDFQIEAIHGKLVYSPTLKEEFTKPIYIMVCNFRV